MKNISKIIWSVEALKDLKEIFDYLELKWTEREMKSFARKLGRQIEIIKSQPLIYPQSRKKNIRRAVISRQTTLYYELSTDEIRIVSLFDNRKDPKKLTI